MNAVIFTMIPALVCSQVISGAGFSWPCKCVVILHTGGGCAVGCILLPHLVSLMSVCIDCYVVYLP